MVGGPDLWRFASLAIAVEVGVQGLFLADGFGVDNSGFVSISCRGNGALAYDSLPPLHVILSGLLGLGGIATGIAHG